MSFAENLSKLLQDNKVSSYRLAKEIGVHITTITNWKEGKSPSVKHLLPIADFFGVTVDELLKGVNE